MIPHMGRERCCTGTIKNGVLKGSEEKQHCLGIWQGSGLWVFSRRKSRTLDEEGTSSFQAGVMHKIFREFIMASLPIRLRVYRKKPPQISSHPQPDTATLSILALFDQFLLSTYSQVGWAFLWVGVCAARTSVAKAGWKPTFLHSLGESSDLGWG